MKRILLPILIVVLVAGSVFGQATNWPIFGRPTSDWYSGADTPKNIPLQWMRAVDPMIAAGGGLGIGSIFYVNSEVTNAGDGSNWLNAKETIEEAYDLCTDNQGDIVYVAQDHEETLGTLVLDTAGVTIIGLGRGEDRPEITFDGTGDIITISAASNTIINLSLRAGVHVIEICFNLTGDADYTTIWGCDFPEPASSAFDFKTAIQLTDASDYVTVAYCTYKHADAAGPVEFIDCGASAAVQGLAVVGNYLYSHFSAAAIYSDQTDTEVLIADNVITNMATNLYAIEMGAASTGWLINNKVATDTYATAIEAGGLAVDQSTVWVDYGQTDTVAVPYFPNATGVARMSATEKAEIEVEVDEALIVQELDHLVHVADNDDPADNSIMADLASATSDWSTFVPADDSLQAIGDRITALSAIGFRGTITTEGTTSQAISTDLTGFGANHFVQDYVVVCTYTTDAGAPTAEIRDITAYVTGTGVFTVGSVFTAALQVGDRILIGRREKFVDIAAILADTSVMDPIVQDLAGRSELGDKVVADMDANSVFDGTLMFDHFMAVIDNTGTDILNAAKDSIIAKLVSASAEADPNDYNQQTMSLQALNTDLDAIIAEVAKVPKSDSTVSWNAAALQAIQDEVEDDMQNENLDHWMKTGVGSGDDMTSEIADGSALSHILTKTGDTSDYARATMSIEYIAGEIDTIEAVTTDLAGISEIGDKIVADMDANSTMSGIGLDHLMGILDGTDADVTTAAIDSVIAKILVTGGAADPNTYDNSTMSLQALNVDLDAIILITDDLAGISQIGDKVVADMDANSTSLYWQERTTAVELTTFPAADCDLFDVDGGPILITSLVGIVTETIDSNAATFGIILDADSALTDTQFTSQNITFNGVVLGTVFTASAANPAIMAPLITGATEGSGIPQYPWYCKEGMIEQYNSAENLDGTITWYVTWKPLSTGITVTAQ